MPFALITIGVLIFFTALNNTAGAFGKQVYADLFSESGGFAYWVAGIVIVGLFGYVPSLKKPSDLFIVLIILAMLLQNKGFFSSLQSGLQSGPSGAASGTSSTSPVASSSGLFSGALGSILASQQIGGGAEPLTTPAPIAGGTPLGQGGIGAA